MTFEEKHPNSEVNTHISFEGDDYVRAAKAELCWNCQRVTYWYSTSFMAPICSEECATEKWNEYWEAVTGQKRTSIDKIRKELGYE